MDVAKRDWDDEYNNSGYIEGAEALPELWAKGAAAYRNAIIKAGWRLDIDLSYGTNPRERFDLVWPEAAPKGLAVFVHGGYWMRFDKSTWTDLAEGARANGWAICLPSYTLAPSARIAEMTAQIGAAICASAALVDGPIHLAGHSAGGHLVSRMMCDDTPLPEAVFDRLRHVLSISGLHDLRPLRHMSMNATLGLTAQEAATESAALNVPKTGPSCTAWVGGAERPEFLRQAQLLNMMWKGFDTSVELVVDGAHNHFTVIDALKDPKSALLQNFLQD